MKARRKIHVAAVFGTRPEVIKLAPVIWSLRTDGRFQTTLVATGQHREMLAQAMQATGLAPDVDLKLMRPAQSLGSYLGVALPAMQRQLQRLRPDMVLVQGDTSTTLAGALSAFYLGICVGHVEAGLRSFDRHQPFPEEVNRRMVTLAADWHFAPTAGAAANLLREGIDPKCIFVTGNPVIDALRRLLDPDFDLRQVGLNIRPGTHPRLMVVTAHRRENFGAPLQQICLALKVLLSRFPEVECIFPVHPNPRVRRLINAFFRVRPKRLHLTEPLPYAAFINVLARAELALTDSGGIQEEAPALNVETVIVRGATERPEALRAGGHLVFPREKDVVRAVSKILSRKSPRRRKMVCPFGDGRAAERIKGALAWIWGFEKRRPRPFKPGEGVGRSGA